MKGRHRKEHVPQINMLRIKKMRHHLDVVDAVCLSEQRRIVYSERGEDYEDEPISFRKLSFHEQFR